MMEGRHAARPGRAERGHARYRDTDAGRGGGGGAAVGHADRRDSQEHGSDAHARDIRPSIQELREAAAMERASGPTSTRRVILDIAALTGWPVAQVESLTFADSAYIVRNLDKEARAMQQRPRGRVYRRTR